MGELAGKVVLITGAGNGIGRECALAAARAGASVVVNDIGATMEGAGASTLPAQQVAEEIAASGGSAVFNTDTVVSLNGVRRMVEQARDAFGALHAVVHPAGIVRRAPLATMSEEDWDLVIDTHLRGAFNVTRATMQLFRDQDEGAYVFFTSAAGQFGQVHRGAIHQRAQRAVDREQLACGGHGILATQARAEEQRHQLRIRQRGRAPRQELFTRTFIDGPIADSHAAKVRVRSAAAYRGNPGLGVSCRLDPT